MPTIIKYKGDGIRTRFGIPMSTAVNAVTVNGGGVANTPDLANSFVDITVAPAALSDVEITYTPVAFYATINADKIVLYSSFVYGQSMIYNVDEGLGSGITISQTATTIYSQFNALFDVSLSNGVRLGGDYKFGWCAGHAQSNTPDIGFTRKAAGSLQVTDGTVDTLRDLAVRNLRTGPVTVTGLIAAATAGAGARAFVTDATVTTFASIVAGSGANGVPVYSDGTNWRIG